MREIRFSAIILGLSLGLSGSTARAQLADACPGTDLGTLSHLGGTLTGDTTGLSNDYGDTNFPATDGSDPAFENCDGDTWRDAVGSGPDVIASFQVDVQGVWVFSTCPGFPNCVGCTPGAADFNTSLMVLKDTGSGCPG